MAASDDSTSRSVRSPNGVTTSTSSCWRAPRRTAFDRTPVCAALADTWHPAFGTPHHRTGATTRADGRVGPHRIGTHESRDLVREALGTPTPPVLVDMHNLLSDWYELRGQPGAARGWPRVEADSASVRTSSPCARTASARCSDPLGLGGWTWWPTESTWRSRGSRPSRAQTPSSSCSAARAGTPTQQASRVVDGVWPVVRARTGVRCEVAGTGADAFDGRTGLTARGPGPHAFQARVPP